MTKFHKFEVDKEEFFLRKLSIFTGILFGYQIILFEDVSIGIEDNT